MSMTLCFLWCICEINKNWKTLDLHFISKQDICFVFISDKLSCHIVTDNALTHLSSFLKRSIELSVFTWNKSNKTRLMSISNLLNFKLRTLNWICTLSSWDKNFTTDIFDLNSFKILSWLNYSWRFYHMK